jgi:hypothetical protein
MKKHEVINKLRDRESELKSLGISSLLLFGSVARNDASPASDVDLFFDYDNPRFSLIDLIKVQERLASILGTEVDVTTRSSLHPLLRPDIEASAIRVF